MLPPIKTLSRSLFDPHSVLDGAKSHFKAIVVYLLIWYIGFAGLLSVYLVVGYLPSLKTNLLTTLAYLKPAFPPQLVLTMQNNQLSVSGADQPVTFALPQEPPFAYPYLLYLDTSQPAEAVLTKGTYALLGVSALGLALPPGQSLIIPYHQLGLSGTFDYPQFQALITHLENQINQLSPLPLSLTLTLVLLLTFLPARLAYCLFSALLLTLFSRLYRTPFRFSFYLKLTLINLVTAESINLFTTLLYGRPTPLVFNLAFIGYLTASLYFLLKPKTLQT
ncbi:hypothetical protein A2W24_06935 [Microgenomates group bacterium RBG_16_45_19]|nr:MAG: hypothetical protein A2W24_06935 [Microgenomates group bacterium RBG_16_45_19]